MFKKGEKFRELWIGDNRIATVRLADDFRSRLLGLMFKRKIDCPLLFEIPQRFNNPGRSAIHTCFMLVEIIAVFVDDDNEIFEIASLKPWKYYKPKKSARYVIEFTKEDYFKCKLEIGDRVKIKNIQMKKMMMAYFIKNEKQYLISDNMAENTSFYKNYPPEPTNEAQIDSDNYDSILLGENELGTVHLHGPFGKSDIKIAYLIGMHPMESKAHRGLFDTIINSKDLNYEYHVYNINVRNIDNDTEGRMDGQLLAREFAAPHIINEKYDLFLDIHSNKGLNGPGTYEKTNFLFAPNFDDESNRIMNQILDDIPELVYYAPQYRTSPPYITLPVAESGTPTIVYETYSYEEMEVTYDLSKKLVDSVDYLEF